ncbi:MAG: hypothetical protein RJA90_689, partial [Bacteroidota bacterium]
MKWIFRYIVCSIALIACAPSFSNQQFITLSLNEAKHYNTKVTGKVYVQADKFQRKANANYYKLIVQSAVKSPVHVIHRQG